MAETTKIGWADATWSPWRGCTKVSEGCANCYADRQSVRNPDTLGIWGKHGTRVLNASWEIPRAWANKAAREGTRLIIFPSLCDPFEDWTGPMSDHNGNLLSRDGKPLVHRDDLETPRDAAAMMTMDQVRQRFWDLIGDTGQSLIWTLLTKRPENVVMDYRPRIGPAWLIASAENQTWHDRRAWALAENAGRFAGTGWSIEPQLGPIRLRGICLGCHRMAEGLARYCAKCKRPNWRPGWVIIGGESGPRSGDHAARPWFIEWGRQIITQCRAAGIPVFMKQLGSFALSAERNEWTERIGRDYWSRATGVGRFELVPAERWAEGVATELGTLDPKGETAKEWPIDMRVQQFPDGWGRKTCRQ